MSATSDSTLPAPPPAASPGEAFFDNLMEAWESAWPKPRVVVLSFPHNPTTECVDLAWMTRLVEFAREREIVLVHDFAYADIAFDGYTPAVDPAGPRGQGRGRRALHDDQVLLDGRLAGRLPGRQRRHRPGPDQAQELPRLRDVPTHPDRRHRGHERGAGLPQAGSTRPTRPVATPCATASTASVGRSRRRAGTMFVWAPIPEPYADMGSLEFSKFLVEQADVATSPGVGFGPGGDDHVRFALIENEQRIGQGVRSLRKALTRLH